MSAVPRSRAEILSRLADTAILYALGIVFVVAIVMGVSNGWSRGANYTYSFGWAAFAIAVVCVEFGAIKKAISEFKAGRYWMSGIAGFVGVLGFVISAFATFNSAATNIDLANASRTKGSNTYEDSRAAKARADAAVVAERKNLDGLRANLNSSIPKVGEQVVTTVAQAEQLVNAAKSDRFWNRTNGCTETKGKDTSKFCAEYRQALGAVDALAKREKTEADVAVAEKAVAAAVTAAQLADTASGSAKPVLEKTSPFVRILERKGGFEREDAELIEAALPSLVLQAFLMLLGLLSAGASERSDRALVSAALPVRTPQLDTRSERVVNNFTVERYDPFGLALDRVKRAA